MKKTLLKTAVALLVIACVSFTVINKNTKPAKGKWVSLFDGKTLKGWHGFNKTGTIPNWEIEDGALVCLGAAADAHGGDIVSDGSYENFELKWEWKLEKGGNSGVMYHVIESEKYNAPYQTGPEYQMIDDIGFPESHRLPYIFYQSSLHIGFGLEIMRDHVDRQPR